MSPASQAAAFYNTSSSSSSSAMQQQQQQPRGYHSHLARSIHQEDDQDDDDDDDDDLAAADDDLLLEPGTHSQQPGANSFPNRSDDIQTFYVRALYDYESNDKILLSFKRGDLIEVLSRLESGWWDGLLRENVRGWFPSNYVEVIPDNVAEEELRLQAIYEDEDHQQQLRQQQQQQQQQLQQQQQQSTSRGYSHSNPPPPTHHTASNSISQQPGRPRAATGLPSSNSTTTTTTTAQSSAGNNNNNNLRFPGSSSALTSIAMTPEGSNGSSTRNGARGGAISNAADIAAPRPSESDFWVPRVTERGEIIYYNTQTGQESYDLPERQEPSDVLSSEGYTTASSRGHSGSVSAGGGGAAAAAQSIKNPAAFYRPEHRSNTFSSSTTGGAGSSMSTSLSSLSGSSTTQHHQQQDDQPSWKSAAAAAGYTQHPHSGTSHTPEFSAFSGPMYSAVNSGQIENGFVNKVFGSSVSSANNINATSSAAAANLNGSSSLSPSSAAAASTWAAALSGATTAAGTGEEGSAHAWKPRLTDDGQIYVVNIETGETRWPPATGAGATHAGSLVNNIGAASASAGAGAAAGLLSGQLASAGGVGVDGKAGATGAGGAGAGAGSGAAPGGPASDKLSGPAGTGPTSFADPSHHARSGASAAVGANAAASGPQGTAASSGPINAGSAAAMSSGGGKGGAITLANIAEAFNLAAQQEAMANQPDKFAMAAQQAISGNRHGRFGSGTSTPNNGPAAAGGGGGGGSSTGSGFASRLAGVGSNGIRGLRSALNAVSGGPATPSAVAAATTQAVAARAAAAAATAAAAPPASVVTATGSVQTSADIDEGSTEGYLRDRYERARHTASATGVRSSRAALLEGAAVAKTEDGAPPSMVNDEAQAVALQRRMEPAPMESMEFLREQALEMIDQLAIAVLPHEYAAHQRSAFFNSLFGPDGELSAAGTDAHIHWLLGHLVHAIRELLLASGALEPTSVDLITLADLSSVSGAGLVPGRLAIAAAQPASTTADANKGGAAAAAAAIGSAGGSGLTPTGGVRPGASISGAVGAASHTSDIPSSLADAMFTLHNANKAAVTSAMPMSRNVRDIVALTASQVATGSPPPDLREASKKACSTLSRVVFSARAISEELSHVQSSLRSGSSTSLAGTGRRSGSVSSGAPSGQQPDQAQLRAERENALRQRVREQAIELAQTVAFITEECERARANGVSGTESWVRRVQPVLRSGIGTAGIGMDIFSGGMAAGWRGSGFSLPSALDTAALRAEAMGNYNNPFDLTKDAQIALASGKLAMRRRPAHQLTASLWKDKIEPHVQDLKVRLQAFNASLEEADRAASVSSSLSVLEEQQLQQQEQTSASSKALDALFASAKETLARLGTVQTLVEDLDLASSLDVDSCSETVNADAAAKGSARRARECLTHFLWNKQDLQDLGCTLMMDLQDRVPTQTLQQTSGAVLASVESLADTIGELVVLVEKQSQGSNTHIGSRARVYGAKDLAPPPTASQVMAAPALGNQGGIKTEIAPIGMGIVGSGLGAASLLDENQINDGAGNAPTAGGAAGAGAAAAAAAQEEDAGVMYLGPGIAVPDGPTGPARNRADSAARGASPALSGTTMGTNNGRNRAGSVTNRSVGTASSVHERAQGSVLTLVGTPSGNAGSSGGNNGAGGDEDSDHTSGVGVSAGGKAGSKSKDGSGGGGGGGAASNGLSGGIPPIVEEAPWFLEPDYAPGDIVMTPEGQVKGATLAALMERLTTHQGFDSAFNTTFLMTYRSFTTTGEFLERVFARYRISPPVGLTPDEHAVWVEKKQRPIQTRVFNVLKLWLEQHFYDGDDDEHIPAIKEFARTEAAKAQASDAQVIHVSGTALLRVLDRRVGASEQAIRTLVHASSAPAPIMPKNAKKVKLLEIDPLEFARQLTIIESAKYREIKPAECLGKAWTAPNAEVNAKGIKSMIALSNNLTGWVMESILAQTELKRRSLFIKHFILIAERCRSLNNYSTMTAIISALNSAPIHRMKRTWDAVNQRTVGVLDGLMRTMSSTKNFAFYRDLLHKLNPPCVPFLGVWLTDLTFIEDGNPDRLKTDNRLINFNKRQKTADIIREIMIYQSTQYNLTPVPLLQTFLADALAPKDDRTQDAMFEQSEKLEPKEREDERIARLLQESGFL
ncbi:cell division cycle- protein [Tilletia horrida]|uniref:Cell division cycle- protein n=1 Tax=Tilletia horrida TaxID=155126 RepID=A0AAN6GLS4_9BASI|nr:cell division cycle- protein [Tilletia horrida]KAK0543584.1 cell division cycle- protein [Tilletia horrida]KAK0570066.1 cell division cycle- protein [Tilletia horrida]